MTEHLDKTHELTHYLTNLDKELKYLIPILLITLAIFANYFRKRDPRRAHLPPHVAGWPIINQTFVLQQDDPTQILIGWARKYGELFRTTSASTEFIWINSREAFKELIDRKSAIYSSRHPMPMTSDVVSAGRRMLFMPYGKEWRAYRGIIHKLFTPQMSASYLPIQHYEAKQLSVNLLDDPNDFVMHNRRYSSSVIMQVTYGRRIPQWDCEDIKKIYGVLARFTKFRRPGTYLVETFPSLANNAIFNMFSNWRQVGKQIQKQDQAVYQSFWNDLKQKIADGTAPHSWGKAFVQSNYEKHGMDELGAIYTAGTMIEAGSETTSQALNNCIIGLLSNCNAIKKAHEELDRVIGSDRAPNYDDEPSLPYIRAIIKEILRWRPVNKFGQNHYNTEDDWYGDYFIPKNTVIMINWWALHYDPEWYPEPEKFKPERFLDFKLGAAEYAAGTDVAARDHFAYGGGRRICPGLHVAEQSLFVNIARLLWGFNLDFAKDENGNDIPIDFTTKGLSRGFLSIPKPFKCSITPRSKKHERVFREEWEEAKKKGVQFERTHLERLVPQ